MHPLLLQAEAEAADAFRRAKAGLQMEKDLARAALMAGDPPPPSASSPRTRALRPATEPAPGQFRVPTDAEHEASRLASFSKLSASDQALLARFGAAPFSPVGVATSAPLTPAQPALSDYDHGQLEPARLLGKSAPVLTGEISLAPGQADPDPRLDPAAMERGSAEARRILGKSAA